MTFNEEGVGLLLAELGDEYQPSGEGLARIRSELGRRRGRRRTISAAAAVIVVLAAAVSAWQVETATQPSTHVRVGGTPTSRPSAPQPPPATTPAGVEAYQPLSFQFTGPATGWVVANNPKLALFHTTDGGSTWADVLPPGATGSINASPNGFYALDDSHAWLAVSGVHHDSTIYRTTDGGATWTAASIAGGTTEHFSFIDAMHGWDEASTDTTAGAGGVDIFETTDGGLHWQVVTGNTPNSGCEKTGISFENATTGFATGVCNTGHPFLEVTHDGGRTWRRVNLAVPAGALEIEPPVFTGTHGAANAISSAQRYLYTTADGGQTWSTADLPTQPRTAVDLLDASHWWFTDGTAIFATHDAGKHWSTTRPNIAFLVNDLQFLSPDAGWALPGDNRVLRTSDGGHTWTAVHISLTAPSTATTVPPVTTPPAPRCLDDQLAASHVSGQVGASQVSNTFEFRNTSRFACTLSGYPSVVFVDGGGHPLPVTVTAIVDPNVAPTATVLMAPGAAADFNTRWVDATPWPNNCITAAALSVTPPGGTKPFHVNGPFQPCTAPGSKPDAGVSTLQNP